MAPKTAVFFLIAILILPLANADVGPSPPAPSITVQLVTNGQPEPSVTQIIYHCMGTDERNASGAVDPHPVILTCSAGRCTNSGGWYYKFNPCFGFGDGYFSYQYDGREVETGYISSLFSETGGDKYYYIEIEAPSGQFKSASSSDKGACPFAMVAFPALLCASALLRNESGGKD